MSNFFLKKPDCVFIHIPKTGGSSIRLGLWNKRYEGPVFGGVPEEWRSLFSFAFVRNPVDRLLSAYRDFVQIRGFNGELEEFLDIVEDEAIIYDERRSTVAERIRHHTIPQTHPFNCLEHAQFVGRFERFEADLARVMTRLNFSAAEIPRLRRTTPGHERGAIRPAVLKRIEAYYAEDFARLGYEAS